MVCPYYKEPEPGESIGNCNGGLAQIPSEAHQNCLCRSCSTIHASFCPIYTKFQRRELHEHKLSIFRRIFTGNHIKHTNSDEPANSIAKESE